MTTAILNIVVANQFYNFSTTGIMNPRVFNCGIEKKKRNNWRTERNGTEGEKVKQRKQMTLVYRT